MNKEEFLVKLGKFIVTKRKEKSLTQEKLGELSGLDFRTIQNIENAKKECKIYTYYKICKILDINFPNITIISNLELK